MNEVLFAFIFAGIISLFSMIGFDKICILISTLTLIVVNYTCGFKNSILDIDILILWTILFCMVDMKIMEIYFERIKK